MTKHRCKYTTPLPDDDERLCPALYPRCHSPCDLLAFRELPDPRTVRGSPGQAAYANICTDCDGNGSGSDLEPCTTCANWGYVDD